jgi:hypothetical protein
MISPGLAVVDESVVVVVNPGYDCWAHEDGGFVVLPDPLFQPRTIQLDPDKTEPALQT